LKTDVALKDGQLNINELHATLFNGPLTANLALRGGTALPGLAASVKFIQLEAGNFTQVVWGKSFLEAQIQGQLSLTTQGESTAAMAASASGGISIKSAAGTIMGLERQTPAANAPYIDLVLDTHIENGVAEIKEGHVGLARGVAFVTGRAALAPYTLDVAVKTEDKPGLITVSGPLDAPKRKVQ
jgi:uncharacterized protein involved in outer membrane biogenesis